MPRKHVFLTPEWFAAVAAVQDEFGNAVKGRPKRAKVNLVVSKAPFSKKKPILAHIDSSSVLPRWNLGHLEKADVTLTLPWSVAKAVFVDNNPQIGMQAFMVGEATVEGDVAKAFKGATGSPNETTAEIAKRIAALTA